MELISATRHARSFAALHSSSTAITQRWTTPPTTDHHLGQAYTRADGCPARSLFRRHSVVVATSHLTWVPVPRWRQGSLQSCCIVLLPATASMRLGVTFQSDANASVASHEITEANTDLLCSTGPMGGMRVATGNRSATYVLSDSARLTGTAV